MDEMEETEQMKKFFIPDDVREKLQDSTALAKHIGEGKTFQELLSYSDETMEKFYAVAYRLFQTQRYEEASDAFVFLTTLNPNVHNYWLGLGMSEQLNNQHHAAIIAYSLAIMTNADNPTPYYHSAACYRATGDLESALASLDLALECAGDAEEHSLIKQQTLAAKKHIQNEEKK
jgi:type III secretion system low calcium response chaperone LcrH/SycD